MKEKNLASSPANGFSSQLKNHIRKSRRGGKFWQRFIAAFLLLSTILLSPAGSIQGNAASAPDLVAPADDSTITSVEAPPLGIPEFKWTAVPGATKYQLWVSHDTSFTTKIVDITTANTTYTPPSGTSFSDGDWFWQVRVAAPLPISAFSSFRHFIKQWATPVNLPTLAKPDDFATIDFYDAPAFSWTPVMGAAKYKLRIYSSSGGCLAAADTAITIETTYQPVAKLTNATYYWCVVPVDPGSHNGTPSAERSFIAGYDPVITLLEPDPNAITYPTFTPTFRWTAVRGAKFYTLQYSTDPTFPNLSVTKTIVTNNTAYRPTDALPNDVNYYWRVSVNSGKSNSNWTTVSPGTYFRKQWYIKPVLLTPVNNYQNQRFPLFSWTPVPGAARYFVEVSKGDPNFTSPVYTSGWTANTFFTPEFYYGGPTTYYWRVTPYDGSGNKGVVSDESSYDSYQGEVTPNQVFPLFYYPPDYYLGFPDVKTNPHEDRTAALPIFIWNRVYSPIYDPNQGKIYAEAYRLEVTTDPTFTSPLDWTVDTENLTAAPTEENPFTPLPNTDYFWRVATLNGGDLSSPWSQIWKTRFDLSKGLAPSGGAVPTLIRPTNGFEYAEETPLLEWFPFSGATSYEVQISNDSGFSSIVDSATVPYPAYVPTQSLAQRSLGAVDFGVYYWRVRKTGSVSWSETRRFQISAQSQWQYSRILNDPTNANQLQIGSDPSGDVADSDYDLTDLQVAQSSPNWYIGFHVPATPSKDVTYALYLDLDHTDSSGAPCDAWLYNGCVTKFYNVTTIPGYRPEFAIYILQEGGVFSADKVYLYEWNGISWNTVKILSGNGGRISQVGNYVELELPNTIIRYQDTTGSYAISLVSLPAGVSGQPQDSVPSDPNVPGSGPISRFANVTERMNLSMPPNNALVDPSTYPSILPFFWDWSIGVPWSGAFMEVHRDYKFTSLIATYELKSSGAYYAGTSHAWPSDFQGDNTYYWRIRPRYRVGNVLYNGAWSQGWSFDRQGFLAQNLQTSVTFATPTFTWDMVEGAESYDMQVSTSSSFNPTTISVVGTAQNSYTYTGTLPNATYFWRVRLHRNGGVINGWTTPDPLCPAPGHLVGCFVLNLPVPTGLTPPSGTIVARAPTFCWTPIVANSPAGDPVLAAWKYKLQISKDATFSIIYETLITEQRCWTPVQGYDDGTYYWRVAMVDGNDRVGNYSAAQTTFIKQYPVTDLLSPLSGGNVPSTPTFVWEPVNGAAKYKLDVSLFSNFSTAYDSIITNNTRYTPVIQYATGKKYYWRVAIMDADGKLGPYNNGNLILDPFPFKIYLPLTVR